jgi:NAD-dependent deacetylase
LSDLLDSLREDLEDAAHLILASRYVVCLTGAGVSVESGIRPFRGPGGIWTEHGEPSMDGYQRFLDNPKDWWEKRLKRPRRTYGSRHNAKPNPGHYALAELEEMDVLKFLITQNTDDLHRKAGNERIAEIHGNGTKMRCISCNKRWKREEFKIEVIPPRCPECAGLVKSDVVGFGEPIPTDVLSTCHMETARGDCMLVIGTSATVYPAAAFPSMVKSRGGSLIEVNLYESELSHQCDIILRGPSGEVLPLLVNLIKEKAK